jgi:hypothetical protein
MILTRAVLGAAQFWTVNLHYYLMTNFMFCYHKYIFIFLPEKLPFTQVCLLVSHNNIVHVIWQCSSFTGGDWKNELPKRLT